MTYLKVKIDELLRQMKFKTPSRTMTVQFQDMRPITIPAKFKFKALNGGKSESEAKNKDKF